MLEFQLAPQQGATERIDFDIAALIVAGWPPVIRPALTSAAPSSPADRSGSVRATVVIARKSNSP